MEATPQIAIEHGAVPNLNTMPGKGGWVAQVWNNGRELRSPWRHASLDRDVAEAEALALATEEAARYIGDWHVTVGARPK